MVRFGSMADAKSPEPPMGLLARAFRVLTDGVWDRRDVAVLLALLVAAVAYATAAGWLPPIDEVAAEPEPADVIDVESVEPSDEVSP